LFGKQPAKAKNGTRIYADSRGFLNHKDTKDFGFWILDFGFCLLPLKLGALCVFVVKINPRPISSVFKLPGAPSNLCGIVAITGKTLIYLQPADEKTASFIYFDFRLRGFRASQKAGH
jgi:hypothetical protein